MARQLTANDIINRAAVECGLLTDPSPVTSSDESFVQLTQLLNAAGQELVEIHSWQYLSKEYQITTVAATDTGTYDLPDDYAYMIDQTGWEHSNRVAVGGPLSSQDWTYLKGRDLVSQSIYASFRINDNKFDIYPQPPPDGLDINFEYISRNWVKEQAGGNFRDDIANGSDIVLHEPILTIKFLKVKFLNAKGMNSASAIVEFEQLLNSRTGRDEGAPILSASNNSRGFPYLHPYYNTGDTGMGKSIP